MTVINTGSSLIISDGLVDVISTTKWKSSDDPTITGGGLVVINTQNINCGSETIEEDITSFEVPISCCIDASNCDIGQYCCNGVCQESCYVCSFDTYTDQNAAYAILPMPISPLNNGFESVTITGNSAPENALGSTTSATLTLENNVITEFSAGPWTETCQNVGGYWYVGPPEGPIWVPEETQCFSWSPWIHIALGYCSDTGQMLIQAYGTGYSVPFFTPTNYNWKWTLDTDNNGLLTGGVTLIDSKFDEPIFFEVNLVNYPFSSLPAPTITVNLE
jgi:hypothetical protein